MKPITDEYGNHIKVDRELNQGKPNRMQHTSINMKYMLYAFAIILLIALILKAWI